MLTFWIFPTAPPRLLPHAGFVDILTLLPNLTTVSDPAVARLSNPYAALPSLHVAWAVWCAVVLWRLGGDDLLQGRPRRRRTRLLLRMAAVAYPTTTGLVVLATANHYLIDVLAGALTAAVSFALVRRSRSLHMDRPSPPETNHRSAQTAAVPAGDVLHVTASCRTSHDLRAEVRTTCW